MPLVSLIPLGKKNTGSPYSYIPALVVLFKGGGGGEEIFLDASCYRNRNNLRPDGPLGSAAGFTFFFLKKEFALRMIPRSTNRSSFNDPFYKRNNVCKLTMLDTGCKSLLINVLNRIFKSNLF